MRTRLTGVPTGDWLYPAAAVAVAALGLAQTVPGTTSARELVVLLLGIALAAGAVATLPQHPLAATLAVAGADVALEVIIGAPPFATFLATMLAVYTLARRSSRRALMAGLGVIVAGVAVMGTIQVARGEDSAFGFVIIAVYLAVATGIGLAVRQRAEYARLLAERAEILERDRAMTAERAAAAERDRLARELHDVVSHGVSVMVLQAEAAREVLTARPDLAARSLDAIGDSGRRAMDDLRRMLGLLGPPSDGDGGTSLAELALPLRTAGLVVDLALHHDPAWEASPAWPTVLRIVQEALTNVVRHAGASSVLVSTESEDGQLRVCVQDDGRGPTGNDVDPDRTGGRGLPGMRRRTAELGGTMEAGPGAGGGFRVCARLPLAHP